MRRTKIVCTLGPSTDNEEVLRQLMQEGMAVARMNFSHGTHEEQKGRLDAVKRIREELKLPVAALLDTKGPEIRIGEVEGGKLELKAGQLFTLTDEEIVGTQERVSITYKELYQDVCAGDSILIDDGLIGMEVLRVEGKEIVCQVKNGGFISNRKGVNVPGVELKMPFVSKKDYEDILFAAEQGFDYIAASFTRTAEDILELRRILQAQNGEGIRIIAKIENQEGVDNLDEILEAADGIMVARGDLGVEIPAARVPILQKQMIRKGLQQGKPVITATQMLDSMMRNPRPTRAEVSDVANAVFDGTSCVMLSGETAGGKYPVEALTAMVGIVTETESAIDYWKQFQKQRVLPASNINDAITHTCCLTAKDLNAKAILTATSSGRSARMICRFRPACPIAALTMHEKVRRQLNISWGVTPYLTGEVNSTDRIFSLSAEVALKERLVENGDTVVITAGVPLGKSGSTNLIKAQVIDEEAM